MKSKPTVPNREITLDKFLTTPPENLIDLIYSSPSYCFAIGKAAIMSREQSTESTTTNTTNGEQP